MRFWDSSAVMPLLSGEATSSAVGGLLRDDIDMTLWWGTWADCAVAISRLRRERTLDAEGEEETRAVLDFLVESWVEVKPSNDLRLLASLISRDHPPKAADFLQLAAAFRWCEGNAADAGFVCLDNQLRRAASEEGFDVLPGEPL